MSSTRDRQGSASGRRSATPATLRARLTMSSSNSSSDSASRSSSCSSVLLAEGHSTLPQSPSSSSQRPRPPTPLPAMATVEAREADPDLASPSALSTLNRFPFVSTISPPQEAEDVLETNCVRASASDQGLVY